MLTFSFALNLSTSHFLLFAFMFLLFLFFNEKFKTLIDFYSLKYLFLYVYNLHNRDLKWFYFCLFLFCCIFRVLLIFISKDYWNRIYIECHNFESHKIQCVQCTSIPWIPLVYFFFVKFLIHYKRIFKDLQMKNTKRGSSGAMAMFQTSSIHRCTGNACGLNFTGKIIENNERKFTN